jgi:hypothetical protein
MNKGNKWKTVTHMVDANSTTNTNFKHQRISIPIIRQRLTQYIKIRPNYLLSASNQLCVCAYRAGDELRALSNLGQCSLPLSYAPAQEIYFKYKDTN